MTDPSPESSTQLSVFHLDLTLQQIALAESLEILSQIPRLSVSEQTFQALWQSRLRIRFALLNSLPPSMLEQTSFRALRNRCPSLALSMEPALSRLPG